VACQPSATIWAQNDDGTRSLRGWAVPYINPWEFLGQNPNCCRLVGFDRDVTPTTLERLLGQGAAVVAVTYQVRYLNGGEVRPKRAEVEFIVTNCGTAWIPADHRGVYRAPTD
jgi:hypothetical protein